MKDNQITFEVHIPKNFRVKDINVETFKLDENWETIVREGHRNIDKLPLRVARRKYG